MLTCNDCIHSEVCVRQKIYGEYSITECKGHFLGKADVQEVKHGEWVDKPSGRYMHIASWCSVCGNKSGIGGIESNRHKPYCPNCGAKMDKRSADNGNL